MALAETAYRHIVLGDHGMPEIAGANTKVVELITEFQIHGLSPEELCFQLPHLSLGQVYSALAYYWDHKGEIDRDMDRRYERVQEMRHQMGQAPELMEKLRRRGLR